MESGKNWMEFNLKTKTMKYNKGTEPVKLPLAPLVIGVLIAFVIGLVLSAYIYVNFP